MTHSALGLNLFGLYGFFRQYNNSARVGRSLRHFPSHSVHCVGRLTTTLDSSRGRRVWKNAACKIRFGHQFVASCQHHNERTTPPRRRGWRTKSMTTASDLVLVLTQFQFHHLLLF